MGLPQGWQATLYDTGKSTYVKLTTLSVNPPAGTTADSPYAINISVDVTSSKLIDTISPIDHAAVYRPVQDIRDASCPAASGNLLPAQNCFEYQTTTYADYTTTPNASVSISSSVSGRNDWNIFRPEYRPVQQPDICADVQEKTMDGQLPRPSLSPDPVIMTRR